MKAIVKSEPGPGLEVLSVKEPKLGSRDVLIKVRVTGICGTDLHIYNWDEWSANRVKPPLILGHEFCGDVVEIGPEVTKVAVGDYVSAECHMACEQCYQCKTGQPHICSNVKVCGIDRHGAYATYVSIPEQFIWKLADDISPEIAAIFDPIGNAVYTVLSGDVAGTTVGIIGCGPIGLAAIPIARASGATCVTGFDISDYRLKMAEGAMGADYVIDSSKVDPLTAAKDITRSVGFDVVLEMSGHPSGINNAFKMVRAGGRVSLLGLPKSAVSVDLANDIVLKGITVLGIHGRRMFDTWYQTTRMIQSGRVDLTPLITHQMKFEEVDKAMEIMSSGRCGKVLLHPE
ncbi:MAG TPA: L-threonine 3-dehydrogenase [Armatimonadota bacterium]|nr:L-threonine 3-dehydrogenase [Armatimonadota bacterium]